MLAVGIIGTGRVGFARQVIEEMEGEMTKVKIMEINTEKMPRSKKSRKKSKYPTEAEAFKLEVAAEMGILEKVKKYGWDSLSAEESGRLGGLIAKKKREMAAEFPQKNKR